MSIAVLDLRYKDKDTQTPGFTRPFLAVLSDDKGDHVVREDPHLRAWPFEARTFLEKGSVLDKLMRQLLTPRYERPAVVYTRQGGDHDMFWMLQWLRRHNQQFQFSLGEVVWAKATAIEIRRKNDPATWWVKDARFVIGDALADVPKVSSADDRHEDDGSIEADVARAHRKLIEAIRNHRGDPAGVTRRKSGQVKK